MLPKFMQEDSTKKKANKREKFVAQQLNSGAFDLYKGDMCTETDYIEHKHTDKGSFSITVPLVEKMIDETIQMGKENSILIIELPGYRITAKVVRTNG